MADYTGSYATITNKSVTEDLPQTSGLKSTEIGEDPSLVYIFRVGPEKVLRMMRNTDPRLQAKDTRYTYLQAEAFLRLYGEDLFILFENALSNFVALKTSSQDTARANVKPLRTGTGNANGVVDGFKDRGSNPGSF